MILNYSKKLVLLLISMQQIAIINKIAAFEEQTQINNNQNCCLSCLKKSYKNCCKYREIPVLLTGVAIGSTIDKKHIVSFSAGIIAGFTGFLTHRKYLKKQDKEKLA